MGLRAFLVDVIAEAIVRGGERLLDRIFAPNTGEEEYVEDIDRRRASALAAAVRRVQTSRDSGPDDTAPSGQAGDGDDMGKDWAEPVPGAKAHSSGWVVARKPAAVGTGNGAR